MEKMNLTDKTQLKLCVIGIGNAGNQAALYAQKNGHPAFAINTSVKDLADSVLHSSLYSYIIGSDGRGSGKRRETAREILLADNKTELRKLLGNEKFKEIVEPADIVVIIASTGGGTGSGISPMLVNTINNIYPSKTTIFYGIVPKKSESPLAHLNTINCLKEIQECHVPYMLADLGYYENTVQEATYKQIGEYITDTLNILRGDYLGESELSMIDERDMLTIISEEGYMATYKATGITQNQIDEGITIQSLIVDKMKKSPAVAIQKDGIVRQMAVISNLPEEMNDPIKTADYSEIINYAGKSLATFDNYAVTESSVGESIVILSGMSLPYNRLRVSIQIVDDFEQQQKAAKSVNLRETSEKHVGMVEKANLHKIVSNASEKVDVDTALDNLPDIF